MNYIGLLQSFVNLAVEAVGYFLKLEVVSKFEAEIGDRVRRIQCQIHICEILRGFNHRAARMVYVYHCDS